MTIKIGYAVTICIINVYAPTAEQSTEEKEKFYKIMEKLYKENQGKGPTIISGDLNARIQKKSFVTGSVYRRTHILQTTHYTGTSNRKGRRKQENANKILHRKQLLFNEYILHEE